jgi:malate synthase
MSIQANTLSAEGIEVIAPVTAQFAEIVSLDALRFVARLSRTFESGREDLLKRRKQRQAELDAQNDYDRPQFWGQRLYSRF